MPPDDEPTDYGFYPAHLRPLSFPTASGTAAADTCERIANLLDADLTARPDLVAEACDGWVGTFRDEFDATWRTQETRVSGLKDDLRTLAGRIRTAMADVQAENEVRATRREQYLADHVPEAG